MPRRGGWRRLGRRQPFRYVDHRGKRITNPEKLARIESLAIPPAWRDVWISPRPRAKLQATGTDAAGRRQYLYHEEFRAAQERAKFDKLIRFAECLPALRKAVAQHLDAGKLEPERICALAVSLVNLGWFRAGSERAARTSRTYGITTLTKRHVRVRGDRITFHFCGKGRAQVHTALVDSELADAISELLQFDGAGRVFRYRWNGSLCNLTAPRLNEYIAEHMGAEFTAKDFRTWGGTLIAAVALAERGVARNEAEAKRHITAVMAEVGKRLGNTPAVARESYVSPAVVEQYLSGMTIADFRPRDLRVLSARETTLNPEEKALVKLLRSARNGGVRKAA
jgi:DNA topoisomerase I